MSPSLHLFLSFHQNALTGAWTDEPSKGGVDARGMIKERRRLGEVNKKNLPVNGVEKPTPCPQTVTETSAPDISKPGASSESGLDQNMAEERPDKDRKRVPSNAVAKSQDSKSSLFGKCHSSLGSRRSRRADPKLQSLQPHRGLPVRSIRSMGRENMKPQGY